MLIRPDRVNELSQSADAFVTAHASRVTWEPPDILDIRAATLLPALLLARVDGASPVEYLTPPEQEAVRDIASAMLVEQQTSTRRVLDRWTDTVEGRIRRQPGLRG
jgi:hypothetical protein